VSCALAASASGADAATALEEIEREGVERTAEAQSVQRAVDGVAAEARRLQDAYQAELKLVDGLETYVDLLDAQLASQREEVALLERSITDVAVIERQILPLMTRMIDSLDQFIELDMPFLLEERRQRVARLRALLGRSDVTVAEKSRRVFEAYQIENEFGRTIESYTGKLDLGDATYDAEFLRIGRLGLLYSTVGADRTGYWDTDAREWRDLPGSPWSRLVANGTRVARQEIAPQLVSIPLDPAQVR
jgi:hypothetical protein